MDGVFANDKLDAYSRERTLQVVVGGLHVLRTHVDRVRVEFGKDLRNGLLDERVEIHLVDILVVDDVQQVVKSVATTIDDVQTVAAEVVGIEGANHNADDDAHRQHDRHVSVFVVHCWFVLIVVGFIRLNRSLQYLRAQVVRCRR